MVIRTYPYIPCPLWSVSVNLNETDKKIFLLKNAERRIIMFSTLLFSSPSLHHIAASSCKSESRDWIKLHIIIVIFCYSKAANGRLLQRRTKRAFNGSSFVSLIGNMSVCLSVCLCGGNWTPDVWYTYVHIHRSTSDANRTNMLLFSGNIRCCSRKPLLGNIIIPKYWEKMWCWNVKIFGNGELSFFWYFTSVVVW